MESFLVTFAKTRAEPVMYQRGKESFIKRFGKIESFDSLQNIPRVSLLPLLNKRAGVGAIAARALKTLVDPS